MQRLALIALGSNLPDRHGRTPLELCNHAALLIAAAPGIVMHAISTWYRTAAMPVSHQPDYINGVVRVQTTMCPRDILSFLTKVEDDAGRTRSVRNAARVLDLDLLAVDSLVSDTPELILPHPRLPERAFVLFPLCDVAPDWRHPLLGLTALELRNRLPPQRIEPIPNGDLPSLPRALS